MTALASQSPAPAAPAESPFPIQVVRSGQAVANKNPSTRLGANVAERCGNIVAKIDGILRTKNGVISVEPLMQLDGDDDAAPRDLDFSGDITLTGSLRNGRKLRSTGDAWIADAVESSHLDVGGDLHVGGGIISRSGGSCTAAGAITARFLSGGQVSSGGDVTVESEITTVQLACSGRLTITRGPIVGGVVAANSGINCRIIGNTSGTPTVVAAGYDQNLYAFVATKSGEIQAARDHVRQVREKLGPLLKQERSLTGQQRERATELLWEAGELEKKTETDIQAIVDRYRAAQSCQCPEITVAETVFPGVTFRFSNVQAVVSTPLNGPLKIVPRTNGSHTHVVAIDVQTGGETILDSTPLDDTCGALLEEYAKSSSAESTIRADCIRAFAGSTHELFQTMVRMPLTAAKPRLKEPGERTYKLYKISTLITLAGNLSGTVWISFSEAVALALATALSGEQYPALNEDARDALGEIANMIVGSAKRALAEGPISISTPTVQPTQDINYPSQGPIILIPFDTAVGRFIIEVLLAKTW